MQWDGYTARGTTLRRFLMPPYSLQSYEHTRNAEKIIRTTRSERERDKREQLVRRIHSIGGDGCRYPEAIARYGRQNDRQIRPWGRLRGLFEAPRWKDSRRE